MKIRASVFVGSNSVPGSLADMASSAVPRSCPSVVAGSSSRGNRRVTKMRSSPKGSPSAMASMASTWPGSVINIAASVCVASRNRCSPCRVWFKPTIAGTRQRGPAEGEEVVGRVVEQNGDVWWRAARAAPSGTGWPTGTTRPRTRRESRSDRRTGGPASVRSSDHPGCAAGSPKWTGPAGRPARAQGSIVGSPRTSARSVRHIPDTNVRDPHLTAAS